MTNDATWTPPQISPGDVVYHCPDGNRSNKPYPAIALRVFPRTIYLWTIGGQLFEGVRYIDDPDLTPDQVQDFGCWALSSTSERIVALETEVKCLSAEVRVLTQALAALQRDTTGPRVKPADNIQGRKP